ncbi:MULTISPECIES: hypothetical protein [unclassified Natrinema]|uniref:hypothetical protein n=1 Tax=unclassified Natrinema TaxID=2622230 RepID=UPI00026D4EEC|nr:MULTISPECIES: hypothetical protein [unclassified Natrinema]AFO58737.1 hypothetical protein NJ7G_3520 [Natrinema sp. J7-2]
MVTVSDRHRDRGQLLLVGAITLAFIILGAVVVYNGVLATETVSSGPTGQIGTEAKVMNAELENGLRGVAHRGNIRWSSDYDDTLENVITTEYADSYLNTTASSRPAATQIENVNIVMEARVATNNLTTKSINLTNTESANNTTRRVGHFALEFDPDDRNGDITVRSVNSSGNPTEVTIKDTGSSADPYEIRSCDIDQPVRIDFVRGTINGTERKCVPKLIDLNESYDKVELEGEPPEKDDAPGQYELVVKGYKDIDSIANVDSGAWEIEADVTYTSTEISYTRLQQVPIYTDH